MSEGRPETLERFDLGMRLSESTCSFVWEMTLIFFVYIFHQGAYMKVLHKIDRFSTKLCVFDAHVQRLPCPNVEFSFCQFLYRELLVRIPYAM